MKPLNLLLASPFTSVFDGVVEGYPDAYIPELWANESIAILEENMVMGNLVYRDFENALAAYGDVVNTRKPGEFTAKRKTTADNVTVQTPTATSVPVVLNQHLHTSFIIKDGDQSKSFKDLVTEYLSPAMLSIARGIDQILSTQVYQFLGNSAGQLGQISGSNAESYMLATRQVLNVNKAYVDGRNLVLGTVSETALLSNPTFTQANTAGDGGTALNEARLGRKFGFDIYMAQNTPYSDSAVADKVEGAVNNASGYGVGAKSFTVDGFAAAIATGSWISIAGDNTPLQVTGTTGGVTPTAITTSQGLKTAVADNAVVTVWGVGAINSAGGYAAGSVSDIVVDTFTNFPQAGQACTFGTDTTVYGIIAVDSAAGTITLDRPLEATYADNTAVNLLPPGSYNLAFHRNAIALVSRPLALPMSGTGARAGVANFGGLSMRVVFTYDGNKQGTLVTLDTLLGVKVLDGKLGAILLG